jgi:hypothetical protein
MPTTAAAALILAVAIIPGALGTYVYASLNGLHWRQSAADTVVRYLSFSVLGLVTYVLTANRFGWPPAAHVIPAEYASTDFGATTLPGLTWPYLGHLAGAALVGILAALGVRLLAFMTRQSHRPATWDTFVTKSVAGRWVVVTLTSGDVYVGVVDVAELGAAAEERDLILGKPGTLSAEGNYEPTTFHAVFLPAGLIQNIAALAHPIDLPREHPTAAADTSGALDA